MKTGRRVRQVADTALVLVLLAAASACGAAPAPGGEATEEGKQGMQSGGGLYEFANYEPGGVQDAAGVNNPNVRGTAIWVKWVDIEEREGERDWTVMDRLAAPWKAAGSTPTPSSESESAPEPASWSSKNPRLPAISPPA